MGQRPPVTHSVSPAMAHHIAIKAHHIKAYHTFTSHHIFPHSDRHTSYQNHHATTVQNIPRQVTDIIRAPLLASNLTKTKAHMKTVGLFDSVAPGPWWYL
jgi:hypothetical protein